MIEVCSFKPIYSIHFNVKNKVYHFKIHININNYLNIIIVASKLCTNIEELNSQLTNNK